MEKFNEAQAMIENFLKKELTGKYIENKAIYTLKQELMYCEDHIREAWPQEERDRYPDLYSDRLRGIEEIKEAIECLTLTINPIRQ